MSKIRKHLTVRSLLVYGIFFTTALAVYAAVNKPTILAYQDLTKTIKSEQQGLQYAVVAGTPWATQAAEDILNTGGNACDAAIAALLMLNVTHGEASAFGGVAPTLYYNNSTQTVKSYIGVGTAPAAANINHFKNQGHDYIPSLNIEAQLIPAGPDVITSLMLECGSKSFAELAAPAIAIAQEGFPMHAIIHRNLDLAWYQRLGMSFMMPSTADVWLQNGWLQALRLHQKITFPDLAKTLQQLADTETKALSTGKSSAEAIGALRNYFYQGPIAEQIAAFHKGNGGLISFDDLKNYRGDWEQPITLQLNEYTWFANGTWSQGIMEPLILNVLANSPLATMKHNSPQYIHTVTQAIELAMSDRDTYAADPAFTDVPLDLLLSAKYAKQRHQLMSDKAFQAPARAGEISGFGGKRQGYDTPLARKNVLPETSLIAMAQFAIGQDTSQLAIVDKQGNSVVITPSDFPKSPMLPNTGINLGDRMTQFRLDPENVNSLAPGKRPRITPHSAMIFKDNQFYMAISTPGGDMQAQALVQVFLNITVFGMELQEAISSPRFYSINSPSSFSPHDFTAAGIRLEKDLYNKSAAGLTKLGYTTIEDPNWDKDFGAVGAIIKNQDSTLIAAADPREETTAAAR